MSNEQQSEDGSVVINSLEIAAVIINGYVSQGRIGPTSPLDFEVETLLAQLSLLVLEYERENGRR